jgi:hypothetical protein
MENYTMLWLGRFNIAVLLIIPTLMCRCNALPVNISTGFV